MSVLFFDSDLVILVFLSDVLMSNIQGLNHGRLLEERMLHSLEQIVQRLTLAHQLQIHLYTEDDLRKEYGWPSVGVDFLIVIPKVGMVAIQTKYKKTRRREDHAIHNFVKSLEYIAKCTDMSLVRGLWVSRMHPFEDNVSRLDRMNIKCISNFDSMDQLVESATNAVYSLVVSNVS